MCNFFCAHAEAFEVVPRAMAYASQFKGNAVLGSLRKLRVTSSFSGPLDYIFHSSFGKRDTNNFSGKVSMVHPCSMLNINHSVRFTAQD